MCAPSRDLAASPCLSCIEVAVEQQLAELSRAVRVAALADHQKRGLLRERHGAIEARTRGLFAVTSPARGRTGWPCRASASA